MSTIRSTKKAFAPAFGQSQRPRSGLSTLDFRGRPLPLPWFFVVFFTIAMAGHKQQNKPQITQFHKNKTLLFQKLGLPLPVTAAAATGHSTVVGKLFRLQTPISGNFSDVPCNLIMTPTVYDTGQKRPTLNSPFYVINFVLIVNPGMYLLLYYINILMARFGDKTLASLFFVTPATWKGILFFSIGIGRPPTTLR